MEGWRDGHNEGIESNRGKQSQVPYFLYVLTTVGHGHIRSSPIPVYRSRFRSRSSTARLSVHPRGRAWPSLVWPGWPSSANHGLWMIYPIFGGVFSFFFFFFFFTTGATIELPPCAGLAQRIGRSRGGYLPTVPSVEVED
ncbi:hypothetical protein BO71DRAFT_3162 [Aspergillus ellipticus CBS 707.79]|uniref:Uncharacterized protein n=1 Tax=Aspergillus ellipticus CBS 707.79 TaxID=1448320 RepID=A0A319DMZ7_9EURO|nr:hypothetical protein BO71DRAFT_3162 [Aspergillus ellipticus CBS 707.79]